MLERALVPPNRGSTCLSFPPLPKARHVFVWCGIPFASLGWSSRATGMALVAEPLQLADPVISQVETLAPPLLNQIIELEDACFLPCERLGPFTMQQQALQRTSGLLLAEMCAPARGYLFLPPPLRTHRTATALACRAGVRPSPATCSSHAVRQPGSSQSWPSPSRSDDAASAQPYCGAGSRSSNDPRDAWRPPRSSCMSTRRTRAHAHSMRASASSGWPSCPNIIATVVMRSSCAGSRPVTTETVRQC